MILKNTQLFSNFIEQKDFLDLTNAQRYENDEGNTANTVTTEHLIKDLVGDYYIDEILSDRFEVMCRIIQAIINTSPNKEEIMKELGYSRSNRITINMNIDGL